MEIKDYWAFYTKATATASEISRKLAFAGLAVVWLFKIEQGQRLVLVTELIWAVFFLVTALALDLFHYLYSALIWGWYTDRLEKELKVSKVEIPQEHPQWIPRTIGVFFWFKVVTVILGFFCIGYYLYQRLFE